MYLLQISLMYLPKINSVTDKYSNYILLLWLNLLLLQITSFTDSMYLNGRIISLEIIVKIFLVKYKWRIVLKLIPYLHLPQPFMAEMIMAKMTVIHLSVCIYLSVMFFFSCTQYVFLQQYRWIPVFCQPQTILHNQISKPWLLNHDQALEQVWRLFFSNSLVGLQSKFFYSQHYPFFSALKNDYLK